MTEVLDDPTVHEHPLVLVDETGGLKLRWCRLCGMLYKELGGFAYAVMIPEWSRAKLEDAAKEVFDFGSYKQAREEELPRKRRTRRPKPLEMEPLFPSETGSTIPERRTTPPVTGDGSP